MAPATIVINLPRYMIVPVLLLSFITALRGIFVYHDNRLLMTKPSVTA